MTNFTKSIVLVSTLVPNILYAGVEASVDASSVSSGEYVTLNLKLSGTDIKKPNLLSVCASNILSSGSQTSITMINGEYKKNYTLSYKFMPKKSCTIEPIQVEVDSKVYKTKPIKVEVKPYKISKDDKFILNMKVDKKELYVGEPFMLTLTLKQRNDARMVDNRFTPPKFQGFWVKNETQPKRYKKDGWTYTQISYTLAPQRATNLEVTPAQLQVATQAQRRSTWGSSWMMENLKWKSYFSNSIKINAKPLPSGIDIVGDFKISANVDKTNVNANDAINLNIVVKGDGNFEDIGTFEPTIDGVSVFAEKTKVTKHRLEQKIAFVSDRNFTIPSISLRYFDLKSKSVKTVKTSPIDIVVQNTLPEKPLVVEKAKQEVLKVTTPDVIYKEKKHSYWYDIALVLFGTIVGYGVSFVKIPSRFERKTSLKNPKIIIMKLMPYKENSEVKEIIDKLEHQLYGEGKEFVDKKHLRDILKKYKLS